MFEIDFSNPVIQILFVVICIMALFACIGSLILGAKDRKRSKEIFSNKVIPIFMSYVGSEIKNETIKIINDIAIVINIC